MEPWCRGSGRGFSRGRSRGRGCKSWEILVCTRGRGRGADPTPRSGVWERANEANYHENSSCQRQRRGKFESREYTNKRTK